MSRKPEPLTPEAVCEIAAEIRARSEEILALSARPELPELGQAILHRGELIMQLQTRGLKDLPPEAGMQCLAALSAARDMDEAIERNLSGFQSGVEEQLKNCREAHQLLNKYKVAAENTGHKSEQA